jgi:glycosyltransferase involved in cell wall biosynthesis
MAEISVVVPCYNHARYLDDALSSVWRQSVMPARAIVVNDGSTDDTRAIADRWQRILSPELLEHYELSSNLGLGAARNMAIAQAPDDNWILCLDADDALEPPAIGVLQYAIDQAPPGTNLITHPLAPYDGGTVWNPPAELNLDQLETRNLFPYCAAFPKSLWAAIGGYDEGECSRLGINDWEFWQRAHRLVGLNPVRVHVPLVRYRQHAGPRLSDQFRRREDLVFTALRRAREYGHVRGNSAPENQPNR